jgi:hypothetical protein
MQAQDNKWEVAAQYAPLFARLRARASASAE